MQRNIITIYIKKNYIAKFSISLIFKKISKVNFKKKTKTKKSILKKKHVKKKNKN